MKNHPALVGCIIGLIGGIVTAGMIFSLRGSYPTSGSLTTVVAFERTMAGKIVGYPQANNDVCYVYYGATNTAISCSAH